MIRSFFLDDLYALHVTLIDAGQRAATAFHGEVWGIVGWPIGSDAKGRGS